MKREACWKSNFKKYLLTSLHKKFISYYRLCLSLMLKFSQYSPTNSPLYKIKNPNLLINNKLGFYYEERKGFEPSIPLLVYSSCKLFNALFKKKIEVFKQKLHYQCYKIDRQLIANSSFIGSKLTFLLPKASLACA